MSSIDWTRWNTVTKKQIPFKDISFIPNNVGLRLRLTQPNLNRNMDFTF